MYSWTPEAVERVMGMGVKVSDVDDVLTTPGAQRIRRWEDGTTLRIIGRTTGGRLIEVWLVDDPRGGGGEMDVLTAFEPGVGGRRLYETLWGEG